MKAEPLLIERDEPSAGAAAERDAHTAGELSPALYARESLAYIPRMLCLVDRNPFHATYGCFDRNFWHYRTADFPSAMYQEAALPLALVYRHPMPGNRWHGNAQVRELAVAGIRFTARSSHRDGSCDDYYPFERALGAAVFSLQACTEAYRILQLCDGELLRFFRRRGDWLLGHDETGRLSNHQALAAVALYNTHRLTGERRFLDGAQARIERLLVWQSPEGWFPEYEGCDPGYLTLTIECLAKYHEATGERAVLESLGRALRFAAHFLHPDGSFGGEYGSRNSSHFFPHGMELLARHDALAAELADGCLKSLRDGTRAYYDDDRLYCHLAADYVQAYLHYCPRDHVPARAEGLGGDRRGSATHFFPHAQLWTRRDGDRLAIVSTAKGGVFRYYARGELVAADAGWVCEDEQGRVMVSQMLDERRVESSSDRVRVSGTMHFASHETAGPWKWLLLRTAMLTVGRFFRDPIRSLLQRRLILARRPAPVRFVRELRYGPPLEVVDTIVLDDPHLKLRRLAIGTDHTSIYVAASNPYQPAALQSWTDLSSHLPTLNETRTLAIRRVLE